MPALPFSPGSDWASLHGIQAVPFAPGPGSAGPNPEWGHEPVMVPGGGNTLSLPFGGGQSSPFNFNFTGTGAGPNPGWGHEPVMAPGNTGDGSPVQSQLPLSGMMFGGTAPSPFPNTNFTGQGNANPQQSFQPSWPGQNPVDWGKMFHLAPLWAGGDQSGQSSGGGLDHNSLAAMINQLLGGNKLFGGSGGAWGGSGGGAWGNG